MVAEQDGFPTSLREVLDGACNTTTTTSATEPHAASQQPIAPSQATLNDEFYNAMDTLLHFMQALCPEQYATLIANHAASSSLAEELSKLYGVLVSISETLMGLKDAVMKYGFDNFNEQHKEKVVAILQRIMRRMETILGDGFYKVGEQQGEAEEVLPRSRERRGASCGQEPEEEGLY